MAWLLALVADLLATSRLLGAVTRQVARDTAVVTLAAVDAVACTIVRRPFDIWAEGFPSLTRQMADAAARVARPLAEAAAVARVETAAEGGALIAVTRNVAELAALGHQHISSDLLGCDAFPRPPCSTLSRTEHRRRRSAGNHARCGPAGRICSRSSPPWAPRGNHGLPERQRSDSHRRRRIV